MLDKFVIWTSDKFKQSTFTAADIKDKRYNYGNQSKLFIVKLKFQSHSSSLMVDGSLENISLKSKKNGPGDNH